MDSYQQFIAQTRYARFVEEENRRETWQETVDRYINFWMERHPSLMPELLDAQTAIYNLEVMPSMRCLMTAGDALNRDHVSGYNCAYAPIDHPRAFDEALYVLMCGTGLGYSVESHDVLQLPVVAEEFHPTDSRVIVADSKIGWASAFRDLLSLLWAGKVPTWDLSRIRPAGARLKTFGGRASGPEPLDDLFRFTVHLFQQAKARQIAPIEAHDLMCKVAQIVVVGGVRRSALISLSDLNDHSLRHAKDGMWWDKESEGGTPYRALANNSAVYNGHLPIDQFLEEWNALYQSRSGERGVFSRTAAKLQVERNGRRDPDHRWGTNPCSEIILRPYQFCNLTEIVVRPNDDIRTLRKKAKIATLLGTLQSTLTDFRYLRKVWKRNCEEERLLGVSMTGIMDHPVLSNPHSDVLPGLLTDIKNTTIKTNKKYAEVLGINQSAAITCVKPSGTVSQLVNSASGIHPRYAKNYIRRVRADAKDPMATWLEDKGVPCEQDVMNKNVKVFSFPVKAPEDAKLQSEVSSLDMLDLWKTYQDYWCEHKPSITVHYTDEEFIAVGAWVWKNLSNISGIAFLPFDGHTYPQAPYEEIQEDQYKCLAEAMPSLDFSDYQEYEDNTTSSQSLACTGGVCEVVDIMTETEADVGRS